MVITEKVEFEGALGETLAARLERPKGPPLGWALFAHCFTCGKDVKAATRIADGLTRRGIAVLRFDFTGLGGSEGEFENTDFSSNVGDLLAAADWLRTEHSAPKILIGHSLGEYAALVAAGSIDFTDAVAVVHERGRLMQAAVSEGDGAMAAILGLDDDRVAGICESVAEGDVVAPANYNAPGQIVIAGQRAAVERAAEACKRDGAKRAMLLPVSVPAHSALMTPAVDGLTMALENIEVSVPEIPVLHNIDRSTRDEPDAIRGALVEQLTHPVPWTGTIRAMTDRGIGRFLECGPGRVLTGLGRRIERGAEWIALEAPDGIEQAVAS